MDRAEQALVMAYAWWKPRGYRMGWRLAMVDACIKQAPPSSIMMSHKEFVNVPSIFCGDQSGGGG